MRTSIVLPASFLLLISALASADPLTYEDVDAGHHADATGGAWPPRLRETLGVWAPGGPRSWPRPSVPRSPRRDGEYTAVDLGSLHGGSTIAHAISDNGTIVGNSHQHLTIPFGFVWRHGTMTGIGALGSAGSQAWDVNTRGDVIGVSLVDVGAASEQHGFVWRNGVMTDLGQVEPSDLNRRSQVIAYTTRGNTRSMLWEDGAFRDLGTLGGFATAAADLNDRGQVVGWSTLGPAGGAHPFLWENGVMTDLGTLGGTFGRARAINERGQIVGTSAVASGPWHAFLWDAGRMIDLGVLPGGGPNAASEAWLINERGQIAGWSTAPGGAVHGVLWEDGRMTDLGPIQPTGLNHRGEISGIGYAKDGTGHAMVWRNGRTIDLGPGAALDIDSRGQVVGFGFDGTNEYHLWMPTAAGPRFDPGDFAGSAPADAEGDATVREGHGILRLTSRVGALPVELEITGLRGEAGVATVHDAMGRCLRRWEIATPARLAWDGMSAQGGPVSSGIYFVRVDAGGRRFAARVAVAR